ncbi:MAG: helix-turn-helix transcriptional regulator [Deltaproteobacteria bacterium]|nr:helix-turn-helix transcriptional regulator [Deltaproteobacteria bacterium]
MKTQEKAISVLAKRIYELRKKRGWSQPELGKKIGTSGAIIGRYERGEISPSIEVARKLADLFEVTTDYLISGRDMPDILKDRDMLNRWQNLEELPSEDKDHIIYVVDGLIRDAKARKTYTS